MPIDTIMSALLWLGGAAGFVGQETAKEAIRRYAPKAFDRLEETVERIWSLIGEGELKEAAREVSKRGLTEAVVASASELQQQTLVLSVPRMENEYTYRVRALAKVVDSIFDLSRQWRMDLLLPGGISAQCAFTLFKTDQSGLDFPVGETDLSFLATNSERSMWVVTKDNCTAEIATKWLDSYRDRIIEVRAKSNEQYVSFLYKLFIPIVSVDGSAMTARPLSDSDWRTLDVGLRILSVENDFRVPIGAWVPAVKILEDLAQD
jgi:hypothetical protein